LATQVEVVLKVQLVVLVVVVPKVPKELLVVLEHLAP
jgi:hypothetical protein